MTLLAFAADCHAAAVPLLLGAGHAAIDQYLLPTGTYYASTINKAIIHHRLCH